MSDTVQGQAIMLHDVFRRRLGSLLAHPNIEVAITLATRRSLEVSSSRSLQSIELSKFRQLIAETLLIYLHFDFVFLGRGPGATKTSLTKLAVKHRIASPRAVITMVQRMSDMNRINRWSGVDDKRTKRFAPTELMLEHHREISRPFLEALPLIGLDHPHIPRALADLTAVARYRYAMGRLYAMGADPVRPFGVPRTSFSNRTGGFAIGNYLRLANIQEFGTLTANRPCPINISHISETVGMSRAHVRNILDELARFNLAQFERGTSMLTYSDSLIWRLRNTIVCGFILTHEALLAASEMKDYNLNNLSIPSRPMAAANV